MKTLKRNQIIIFVIALMLIVAGYLNYETNISGVVQVASNVTDEEWAQTGDAELVSANEVTGNTIETSEEIDGISEDLTNSLAQSAETITTSSDTVADKYFTSSRLERDTMYSQMIDTYQKIIDNSAISVEQKSIATEEISKINSTKNAIMIAENLIKTKGIEDVIIFVNEKNINVILKGEKIEQEKIAQVQNIISRELNSNIEDIHISSK